jgi:hypothetical protein
LARACSSFMPLSYTMWFEALLNAQCFSAVRRSTKGWCLHASFGMMLTAAPESTATRSFSPRRGATVFHPAPSTPTSSRLHR